MKILLVEDNCEAGEALVKQLTAAGHKVIWAVGCVQAEGLLEYSERSFGAVVIDWLLGDENGLDVVKAMRTKGDMTPAILMTAAGDSDVMDPDTHLPPDVPVLHKPFDVPDLLALLAKVVP